MSTEYEKNHNWKFLYLGADVDAFGEAGGLAIAAGSALNMAKTPTGIRKAYHAMSSNMLECRDQLQRSVPSAQAFAAYDFDEEQRKESME